MYMKSRLAALQKARIQAHFSNVIPVQKPTEESLKSQAIASMRAGPKLSLKKSNRFLST